MGAMDEPAVEKIAEEEQADPFKVLIATMLSAQTRDPVTFDASNRLFARADTPRKMVRLRVATIEKLIYPVSFYRNKAQHVKATCRQLNERYGGQVPTTMAELVSLPGVGRKTANLVVQMVQYLTVQAMVTVAMIFGLVMATMTVKIRNMDVISPAMKMTVVTAMAEPELLL